MPVFAVWTSGTRVDRPEINGRDDTAQVLNGWGEVVARLHAMKDVPATA